MKKELNPKLIGTRVRVYRNLRNQLLSVQSNIGGSWLVVGHVESLLLYDAEFKVSEAGRKRVIEQKRKNVHAFVYGELADIDTDVVLPTKAFYNPYKYKTFVTESLGRVDAVNCASISAVKGITIL
jgi:hypothetical protein